MDDSTQESSTAGSPSFPRVRPERTRVQLPGPRKVSKGETVPVVFQSDLVTGSLVVSLESHLLRKIPETEHTIEVRKGPVEQVFEFPEPQMVEQLVDVPKIVVELAVSSGEAGFSGPGERDDRRRLYSSRNACW